MTVRAAPRERRRGRRVPAPSARALVSGAILAALLAATAGGVVLALEQEQSDAREAWDGHAQRAARLLSRELSGVAGPMRELRGLQSAPLADARQFQAIARVPVQAGLLTLVAWTPRVVIDGRVGYPVSFGVPAPSAGGPRPGSDLLGQGPGAAARVAAAATGGPVASAPTVLRPGGAVGAVVVARVPAGNRRRPPVGMVVGEVRGVDLATAVLRGLPQGSEVGIETGGRPLAGPPGGPADASRARVVSLGREWAVLVRGPERPSWALPGLVLGAGLWLTLTVGLLLQDNADRARVARELRRRVDYDAALLSAIQDGLLVLDPDGRVTEANERFLEIVGLDRARVIGAMPPYPWWHEDHAAANAERLAEAMERGSAEHDMVFRRPDGTKVAVIATRSAVDAPEAGRTGYLAVIKDVTERRAAEAEQAALRRVAVDVAEGTAPSAVFRRVAAEVAALLAADRGVVVRFGDEDPVVVGSAGEGPMPGDALRRAAEGRAAGEPGQVAAPVRVEGRLWGAVGAASAAGGGLPAGAEGRLERFAGLVGTAIANAAARAELVTQASTDELTGLANRRVFSERLAAEAERALRYGRALSLVQIDLDHFKRVNDTHGHPAGDEVLRHLARRLQARRRSADLVARVGGEEFAWLMPETEALAALQVADRLRAELAASPVPGVGVVTVSLGVADLAAAGTPARLVAMADAALYRAKRRGRDRVALHLAGPAGALMQAADEGGPADALRARLADVARRADAAGPAPGHAVRVARAAALIAGELGWDAGAAARLEAAGLAHDAGLVAVPGRLLAEPAPPGSRERRIIDTHPLVGAELARRALDDDQAGWIRTHHERMDGRGTPDGRAAAAIPEGGRILAVAEAWATRCEGRPGDPALAPADALAACRADAGAGLWEPAVEALARLDARGALPA